MPPEGYDTVTLPESLIDRLDELDGDSYTATIRMLVSDHKTSDIEAAGLVALEDQLEEVQETLESVQNDWEYLNAEEIHGGVHESDHQLKDVLNRIDDLESQLPRKLKEELSR